MTLAEIVAAHPDDFYRQDWWKAQAFAHEGHGHVLTMPTEVKPVDPSYVGFLPYAASLALLYVTDPGAECWRSFLWTADVDDEGNRVYVGGLGIYGIELFQIHRNLEIDERWGCGVWQV